MADRLEGLLVGYECVLASALELAGDTLTAAGLAGEVVTNINLQVNDLKGKSPEFQAGFRDAVKGVNGRISGKKVIIRIQEEGAKEE